MKSRLLFFILTLFSCSLFSQNYWKQVNFPSDGGTIFSIMWLEGTKYLAGTSKGIYMSTDNGENWSYFNKPENTTVITDVIIKTTNGTIIAGTSLGIYRSTDKGNAWIKSNNGIDNPDFFSLYQTSKGDIFAGGKKGEIYVSKDDGVTWTKVLTAHPYSLIESIVENSKGYIFAGVYNAYDQYAEGVFRSTDNGKTWTSSKNGMVSPTANVLLVVKDDVLYAGTQKGFHRSTDDGLTWQQMMTGLSQSYGVTAMIAPTQNEIYFGNALYGVFRSTNGGNSWSDYNAGLTRKDVSSMILAKDMTILVGSSGYMFKSLNKINNLNSSYKIPDEYVLKQNYPNPFNPSTIIEYILPEKSYVTIKVYNILGEELDVLVNELKESGSHKIEWNPKNLSSGIYFYKMFTNNHQLTRKMIFIR
ncbi:MAG TPA: T9SS type A sorting domain-containing protein [Bacteroidota bacterium]|nr:T9SS type A sorting domain-containing protein [Bacteroidota bacterium]